MKILSITPAYLPQVGGIEQVVHELAVRLQAKGHQVDVAHVEPQHKAYSVQTEGGLRVHRVPLLGHRLLGWAPDLKKLTGPYDVLHVHDPQLMAITLNVMARWPDVPAVLSTHGGFNHTNKLALFKRLHERFLLGRALRHYKRVLATSQGDLDYFRQYAAGVDLCSNGVNVDKFGSVVPKPDRSLTRWIAWGRLSRNKRIDQLIDTVALAHRTGTEVDLLICGRDFDHIADSLKAHVLALGLSAHVRFVSHLTDAELLAEIATRGVYATASEHEGFGLSVVEALAAGLFVMCRDMSPLNGFFKAGDGGAFLRFDGGAQDQATLAQLFAMPQAQQVAINACSRANAQPYSWHHAVEVFEQQLLRAARA
jgi:alpha-1,3-mannosyltransferase